jgi:hypothetical protein
MIKKFNDFINEGKSVRELMTSKSPEELVKIFNNMREDELAVKELQGMQSIAQYYYLNNAEAYIKTDVDYHKIYVDSKYSIYYISTGRKSLQLGIPPSIEGITISDGLTCFYVDVACKFVGKEDDMETLIITTFQNDYRGRLQDWNDMTMEDGIDVIPGEPSSITHDKVDKWYKQLKEMFEDAGRNAYEIKSGEELL